MRRRTDLMRADPLQIELSSCLDPDADRRKRSRRAPTVPPALQPRSPEEPTEMPQRDPRDQQERDTRRHLHAGGDVDVDVDSHAPTEAPDSDVL
jgi:hypothetical protein